MNSIINSGIFTSQGFFAAIFLALGIYLLTRGNLNRNPHTKTDKRIFIGGIISIITAVIFLVIYIVQIRGIVA